jgi:hypothetical protein
LLKLGITVSERTVSRYLHGRPTARSQTWRTFLANHFAGQISPFISTKAGNEETVVASGVWWYRAASIEPSNASLLGPTVVSERSRQLSSLGVSIGPAHLRGLYGHAQEPRPRSAGQLLLRLARRVTFVRRPVILKSVRLRVRPSAVLELDAKDNQVVDVLAAPTFRPDGGMWRRDLNGSEYWRMTGGCGRSSPGVRCLSLRYRRAFSAPTSSRGKSADHWGRSSCVAD